MQFKSGDKIRVINGGSGAYGANGKSGTIITELPRAIGHGYCGGLGIQVLLDNGEWWGFSTSDEVCVELIQTVKQQSIMKKLGTAVKKFLNADLQAQLKAGYRNGDLELTQEGKDVLLELLADTVTDQFTASANDKITDEEKQK